MLSTNKKTDKEGYDEVYKDQEISFLAKESKNPDEYVENFKGWKLTPFCEGGFIDRGYVRGTTFNKLVEAANETKVKREQLAILDAGCGMGDLSVYLACKGFKVIGVDISPEACTAAKRLSDHLGVSNRCTFLPESLDKLSLADSSIDFIIGHQTLHHFIKYENVPKEFYRVMKEGAQGFFADGFHENVLYRLFHNKEKMEKLGDVVMYKKLIDDYFKDFEMELIPGDWFSMIDKLYVKLLPQDKLTLARKLCKLHFWLDRRIPDSNRLSLALSGSVMTTIKKV